MYHFVLMYVRRFAQYRMSFALINLFIASSGSLLLVRK